MLKLLKRNTFEFSLGEHNTNIVNLTKILLFVIIALLLAQRDLFIAKDDYNYLYYFTNAKLIETDNSFLYLIEEPLWRLWTVITTAFLSPENAFRFTLFFSSFLFLISISHVNEKLFLLVILAFVIHQHFATQMYFNQIRQGFALSIFLFGTVYLKRPLISSIIALLVHASFVFPFLFLVILFYSNSVKYIILYSLLFLLLLYLGLNFIKNIDLGRRTGSYEFQNRLTINYYIQLFVHYVPLFFLVGYYNLKKVGFWFKLTITAFLFLTIFTLFYSAAGRLMYYLSAFILLMLLEGYKSKGGKIAVAYHLLFLFSYSFVGGVEVWHNWELILNI